MTEPTALRRKSLLQASLVALTLTAAAAGLSACNTTEGFGRDVEAAGDAIEDTAQDAQN